MENTGILPGCLTYKHDYMPGRLDFPTGLYFDSTFVDDYQEYRPLWMLLTKQLSKIWHMV